MADEIAQLRGNDPTSPRHARIRKELEERLLEGHYPVGSFIPTELELATEFNSSRSTVREALRYLSERGYVERKQGVGTRVIAQKATTTFYQSFGSLEELFQVATETYFVIMETTQVILDERTAELVGGTAGEEWSLVSGVRWTEPGGRPICYVQSFIPHQFEHLVEQLPDYPGPFFSLLERHADGPIEEVEQVVRSIQMPVEFARHLGLKPGAWSLQLLRRYLTAGGVLIASFNWHPAEQMAYTMRIHRAKENS